jgi:murein DD-endopeptidase MepM/ murein hydrolase activator NlpD
MARLLYKYDPHTCRYERFEIKGRLLWKRIGAFFSISVLIAVAGYFASVQYFQSIDELLLAEKNKKLKVDWSILQERMKGAQGELAELIEKDDNNYRVILDSNPLSPSIREAGTGGSEKFSFKSLQAFPYIIEDYKVMDKLRHKVDIEIQSYHELEKIMNSKLVEWAARPAIQPISNNDLERLHFTYGARLHPIFKVWKDHKGLDMTAAEGTPVYVTGDGEVSNVYYSDTYGKVIFVDHGDKFQTRYAHLSGFNVMVGEPVKRGQVIGYVGSTGTSVSAHLHYEILINGQHVNPINFFQRDLSNEEYQKLIELGSENGNSLD